MYNIPVCNEYIKTKIRSYNENIHGYKKITKDENYGHSILLLESICEIENKYYPKIFLDKLFEKSNDNNKKRLFKELVQITD